MQEVRLRVTLAHVMDSCTQLPHFGITVVYNDWFQDQ